MELYHATRNVFSIGEEIISNSLSPYYPEASDALDSLRPDNAPARINALYSADSSAFAYYFLIKQNVCKSEINLYKVKVQDPWQAVFSIPHVIQRRIEKGQNIDSLINEYWDPTENWEFYEYLSTSFVITDQLDHPNIFKFEMQIKALSDSKLTDKFS